MSDFVITFYWYLILLAFGVGFFPLTFLIFQRLKDQGYGFSKVLALLFTSYAFWLLSSLKVFNLQWLGIWVLLIIPIPWILTAYRFDSLKNQLMVSIKKKWRWWLLEEGLFLLGLF